MTDNDRYYSIYVFDVERRCTWSCRAWRDNKWDDFQSSSASIFFWSSGNDDDPLWSAGSVDDDDDDDEVVYWSDASKGVVETLKEEDVVDVEMEDSDKGWLQERDVCKSRMYQ